jgi:cytochrome c oxidase cbb3-type subunit I/II
MMNPVNTSPGSIMPAYAWLAENDLNLEKTTDKLKAMQSLGVPYSDDEVENGLNSLKKQAKGISENLAKDGIALESNKELVAMIAYLQRLGMDIKNRQSATAQK